MPEEAIIDEGQNQITYNVVLDPGDIARQAEEIRNQLDLALGVGSNAGAQFAGTTEFINPQFGPPLDPSMSPMQGNFGSAVDESFWDKAKNQFGDAYQNLSAGMDRIRQDMSMMVDRGSNVIQRFQPTPQQQPMNPYENLLPDTFGEYLLGSLGFGGDITGPVAPSEYQRYSNTKLGEELSDFGKGNMGAGIGMAIGTMIAPGPGTLAGWMWGSTVDEATELLTGTYNKRNDLAEGLQEIARQQYGTISQDEARGVADQIVDFTFTPEGIGKGYDTEEISTNILQFANEGGFSNVRNTEQFKEKIQAITEDLRQFGRDMGIFQEDAISILAEMEQKGIVKVENMRELSSNMKFYSGVTGMSPTQLLQGAAATAEQFRQTMEPEAAMNMFVDATVESGRLIRSTDPDAQSLAYRLGGQQGITQTLINSYDKFYSGSLGELERMTEFFGKETGGSTGSSYEDVNISAQNFNPATWFDYQGDGGRKATGDESLGGITTRWGERALDKWKELGLQDAYGNPTPSQLKGILNQFYPDLTRNETDAIITTLVQNMKDLDKGDQFDNIMKSGKVMSKLQSLMQNEETTLWGDIQNMPLLPGGGSLTGVQNVFKDVGYGIGTAVEWAWNGGRDVGLGGPKYNSETGEIEYGLLNAGGALDIFNRTPSFLGETIDEDLMSNDPGVRRQLLLGSESDYNKNKKEWMKDELKTLMPGTDISTLLRMPKKERERRLKQEEDDRNSVIDFTMGNMSSALENDKIFAYSMLRTGPDVKQRFEETAYYAEEIEKWLEEEPGILQTTDGSLKTSQETTQMFIEKFGNKFDLNDAELQRVVYQGQRVQDNTKMRTIITDDKELKGFEAGAGNMLKMGRRLEGEFLEEEEKRLRGYTDEEGNVIKGSLQESTELFQSALHEELLVTKLPESLGSSASILGKSYTVLAEMERNGEIGRDEYDEYYMKEMEKSITGGKGFTTEQRDAFGKLIYRSPVKKPFTYMTKEKGYVKDINEQGKLEKFKEDYESQFEGETLDIGKVSVMMAWNTMAERKLGTGESFELTKYTKKEFDMTEKLYEDLSKEPMNEKDLRSRLEYLRQNTTLSQEDFRDMAKEKYDIDINDDDKQMGLSMRIIKDNSLLHSQYLYSIATRNGYGTNLVAPSKSREGR